MKPKNHLNKDVIILGAGAAGMMCAIEAGKRGRSVAVLEHNKAVGKKIRISGGGRCNFTNINAGPANFLSENPHFAKSALARYTPPEFCALVQKYKIPFYEKKLGQLFCEKTAQDIIDLLKKECDAAGVEILLETTVSTVKKSNHFHLRTNRGEMTCERLVIATGGLSIPTLGATDFGYTIAKQFGITVNPCRPALVPLTLHAKDLKVFEKLAGVAVDTIVSFEGASFRENILFTHRGLSGPAILQISSYWKPNKPIVINLLPDIDVLAFLESQQKNKSTLKEFLKEHLPARLIEILCEHFLHNKALNSYSAKQRQEIADALNKWKIVPNGTEGYAKAEVTAGGVDTKELSSKTMESKKVPGLFFIGEVVDVTGWLGGFNFQWAWASGHAAGESV